MIFFFFIQKGKKRKGNHSQIQPNYSSEKLQNLLVYITVHLGSFNLKACALEMKIFKTWALTFIGLVIYIMSIA